MSQHKQIIEAFFRALGAGDEEAMSTLVSEDIVAMAHGSSLMSGQRDRTELLAAVNMLAQATENGVEFEILSMTEEEDRLSCEAQGKSVLVTGQNYNNRYHFLFRLRDGRIYSIDEYFDTKLVDELLTPLMTQAAE